jgi:hypothetical protein
MTNRLFIIFYRTAIKLIQVTANKIVNGKEEYMGTLSFSLDPSTGIFISKDQERNVIWEFRIKENTMAGKLFYKDQLYRIIEIKKEN